MRISDWSSDVCSSDLPKATDEQRDVCTLTTPVGVELVEHQERQALGLVDQMLPVCVPGEDQLEHHVVGEEDVGRVPPDLRLALGALLAGVLRVGHAALRGHAVLQTLLELLLLAVGKRSEEQKYEL